MKMYANLETVNYFRGSQFWGQSSVQRKINMYGITNILYHQLQKKKNNLITCRPLHCLTLTKVCFDTSICSFTQILDATAAYI